MGKDQRLDPQDVSTEDFETYLYKWGEEVTPGSGDVISGPGAVEVDGLGGMPIYRQSRKGPREVIGAIHTVEKDDIGVKIGGRVLEGSLRDGMLALEGRATYLPGAGRLVITGMSISGISVIPKVKGS